MQSAYDEYKNAFANYRDRDLRQQQIKGIDFALRSDKKFVVISAPTGSGKSLLGLSLCAAHDNSVYLVHSKPLQVQITNDFPEVYSLFGRGNYSCTIEPTLSAADCFFPGGGCPAGRECSYKVAKAEALASRYRVLNYHYFMNEANFVRRFSDQPLIIVDEADSLENLLYSFIEITITENRLNKYGLDLPRYKTTANGNGTIEWRQWGKNVLKKVSAEVRTVKREIDSWGRVQEPTDRQVAIMKMLSDLEGHERKFTAFVEHVDDSWLLTIEDTPKFGVRLKFKPTWMTEKLAEIYLWQHADQFILMSASFPPKEVIAKTLGINPDEIDTIVLDSTFAVENRTNYLLPVAELKNATMEYETPRIKDVIEQIIAKHPNDKGLIHSVNWTLNNAIMQIGDRRLITHDSTNKQERLDYFKKSSEPLVFVSPSSERGIDLADDYCRFIIVAKSPFLHLGDKGVKARLHSGGVGQLWFVSNMMMTVLQMLGRGVRNEKDHCTSYILDSLFVQNLHRYPSVLPSWFRDSLILADPDELGITMPPPAVYPTE